MKRIILFFCIICFGATALAQTHDLTTEELDAFKIQCQERIDAFQLGLEIIADKKQDPEVKQHYINTLPDLFMGNGEEWTDVFGQKHNASI